MQYNNRAILGMIASALNPLIPAVQAHSDHIAFHYDLTATPDRNALIFHMTDGRQFHISVEEVVLMFATPGVKAMILAVMTDTQYYCEKCDRIFEYSYPGQKGCEQCGLQIQDNNIAEVN